MKQFEVVVPAFEEAANEEVRKLKVVLHQNMATSLNHMGEHQDAILRCSLAIGLDPNSWKAHYQRALAQWRTKQFDEAIQDLKSAIKLNPQDKKLRSEFETLKAEKKAFGMSQQSAMQKAFAGGLYNEKEVKRGPQVFDELPKFDPENA